ncbi:MAG TPA: uroporphyrinogen decarboxylase family protein [Chthonomonadales bacterium]|nr:uroporphyrinogen decarboxylase family protein [Chthonomonadales bacterium]
MTAPAPVEPLPCGERLVRCLTGAPVDRVPFGVGIGWRPWGDTVERWRHESGDSALDPGAAVGLEQGFCTAPVTLGLNPPYEPEVLERTEGYVIHRDALGIVKRDRGDLGSMPEFLEHPVRDEADWERIREERLRPDDDSRWRTDWDAFRGHVARTGEAVQVGAFPYGVFGTPRDLMGAERLLLAFCDRPALVRDMMERLTDVWLSVYERAAAEVRIDHIHIWEDMSGRHGSLISPRMVREFMMPCYDRIVAFARRVGVRIVSVDTDGDCTQLVPVMAEHGINMFFPFEVQAGNDILEVRRRHPDLGIMGGLDKRALAGSAEDVDREVERARRMLEHGRYVPGFDHLIPPDASWHNYLRAAGAIRGLCHGASRSHRGEADDRDR